MDEFKGFLRHHWPDFLAFAVLLIAIARYISLKQWQQNLNLMIFAGAGFIAVVASEHVAGISGRTGWTTDQKGQGGAPANILRVAGAVMLLVSTVLLFRR